MNRGHFFSSGVILRLLAAGSEVRSMGERLRQAGAAPLTGDARDVQSSPGASFIAADRDHGAENVDGVAGSEFVDDLIRERE